MCEKERRLLELEEKETLLRRLRRELEEREEIEEIEERRQCEQLEYMYAACSENDAELKQLLEERLDMIHKFRQEGRGKLDEVYYNIQCEQESIEAQRLEINTEENTGGNTDE